MNIKEKLEDWYWAIARFLDKKHDAKNFVLRHTMGVGCCDLFGYYDYIARKIARDLRLYKKHNMSWPSNEEFKTFDDWQNFIQQLVDDLDYHIDSDAENWIDLENEAEKKQGDAMRRFAEHFETFWI